MTVKGIRGGPSRGLWLPAAIAAGLLLAWEGLVAVGAVDALFFPPPTAIGATAVRLIGNGKLLGHVGVTLGRLFGGLLLGALPGLLLGLTMGWSRRLRGVVDPFVAAFHPVPKTALLPLFMVILGLGEAPKVVVVALAAFFPMLINSMAGVRQISPIHFEVAENYEAGPLKVLSRVVLPGSLPLVLAGLRLAFNTALVVVIAVELLAARRGLGAMIWSAWETMRTEELYAAVAVAGIIGITAGALLQRLTVRLVPWQTERQI